MKAVTRLGLAVAALLLTAGAASGATGLRLVEGGRTAYPEKSYVLTLPSPRSLTASDVTLTENGSPVTGITVAPQGTATSKTAVVLVIDQSLTMKGAPLADALAAARRFATQAGPAEEIAVVTFNGVVDVEQPFTSDSAAVDRALLRSPKVVYGTKNFDALETARKLIAAAHARSGSIIIMTDGQSVGSVAKPAAVQSALVKAHIRVFALGLPSPAFAPEGLESMATATGGLYVQAAGGAGLDPILLALGQQLSSDYLLTYQSHANPETKVSVDVTVRGIGGIAQTAYRSAPLTLTPAPPYRPSAVGRVVQSEYTAIVVVLLFAGLLWFAISFAARTRVEPLVDRVGDFVSVQQQASKAEPAPQKPAARRPGFLTRTSSTTGKPSLSERLAVTLELAEVDIAPGRLMLLTAVLTILALFVLVKLLGVFGILFGLFAPFLIIRFLIKRKVTRRRKAFADQLPDNLDVLASALRAGHSLVGALSVVADDAAEPAKSEFKRVLAEEQFGVQLEDAFKIVVQRMDNTDLDQIALVARLQREMGSNSAEVLDRVIETVRARTELRRLVSTLTAQGRLSRWVLTGLPIAVALGLTLINPAYMSPLFHNTAGKALLTFAAGMVALGSFVIGKIIDIKT